MQRERGQISGRMRDRWGEKKIPGRINVSLGENKISNLINDSLAEGRANGTYAEPPRIDRIWVEPGMPAGGEIQYLKRSTYHDYLLTPENAAGHQLMGQPETV